MATIQKRQPAKRFWIADMLSAEPKVNEQGFKYYTIREKDAIRVNIIAGVIASYINETSSYAVVTVDDGSAQMRLKSWNEDIKMLAELKPGDIVLVIGRINADSTGSNEIFVRPEIIRTIDVNWLQLRRAELQKEFGQAQRPVQQETPQPKMQEAVAEERVMDNKAVPLSIREKVVQAIESCDTNAGAEIAMVIKSSLVGEAEAQAAINELIREGEAFQPKQGFIKLLS